MRLLPVGWVVVHSIWQGLFIAGATALALALVGDPRRARLRYAIGCASLASMVLALVGTAFIGTTAIGARVRFEVIYAIDNTVGVSLPTLIAWASVIVPAAAVLWMTGLAVRSIAIVREWRRARSLRGSEAYDVGDAVRGTVADLSARMDLRAPVDVRCSAVATVPLVLGWREPLILLPAAAVATLPAAQLRAVLAHELAHVRRRDALANLLLIVADTLLFHHPAARWVSRRIRTEREYCCDDVALEMAPDAEGYARALAALEDRRGNHQLAVAAAAGTLLDRIQRIMGHPRPTLSPSGAGLAFAALSLLAGAILALAMSVPPSLPAGAQLRRRMPAPAGVVPTPPPGRTLPRTPAR